MTTGVAGPAASAGSIAIRRDENSVMQINDTIGSAVPETNIVNGRGLCSFIILLLDHVS